MRKLIHAWFVTIVALILAVSATAITYHHVQYQQIINSLLDATPVGSFFPSSGAFTTLSNTTGGGTITDTFIGNLTGNVAGNATTSSAFDHNPSNCAANIAALGIAADGTAECNTLIFQAMNITSGLCTTSGAETYCTSPSSGVYSWPVAFGSAAYIVTCTYVNQPTGSGSHPGLYGPYITSQTAAGIAFEIQSGSASAAGNNTPGQVNCIGIGPHA